MERKRQCTAETFGTGSYTHLDVYKRQELKSPVILGVSEGAGKYMTGFGTVAAMVKAMHAELGITAVSYTHLVWRPMISQISTVLRPSAP